MKKFEDLSVFYDHEQFRSSLLYTDVSEVAKNYRLTVQNKIEKELLEFLSCLYQRPETEIINFIKGFNNVKLKHLKCVSKDYTYSYFYKEEPVLLIDYSTSYRDTLVIHPIWKKEGGY